MDTPALSDLLQTSRLYPEERAELLFLIGRIARLEVIEADAQALVDRLPKTVKTVKDKDLQRLIGKVRK